MVKRARSSLGGGVRSQRARGSDSALRQASSVWAQAVLEKATSLEKAGEHPASYVVSRLHSEGEHHKALRDSIVAWLHEHGSTVEMVECEAVVFPAESTRSPMLIPLDSLCWPVPSSGLPPALDWFTHLLSIVTDNYDSRRAPVDIKPVHSELVAKPLESASVSLVKGFTRSSIVAFALLVTFERDLSDLSEDDADSLTRPGSYNGICPVLLDQHRTGALNGFWFVVPVSLFLTPFCPGICPKEVLQQRIISCTHT